MDQAFRQVDRAMHRDRDRSSPFANHDVVTARDPVQPPPLRLQDLFELLPVMDEYIQHKGCMSTGSVDGWAPLITAEALHLLLFAASIGPFCRCC